MERNEGKALKFWSPESGPSKSSAR